MKIFDLLLENISSLNDRKIKEDILKSSKLLEPLVRLPGDYAEAFQKLLAIGVSMVSPKKEIHRYYRRDDELSLLNAAAKYGNLGIARVLLRNRAEITLEDVHFAIEIKSLPALRLFREEAAARGHIDLTCNLICMALERDAPLEMIEYLVNLLIFDDEINGVTRKIPLIEASRRKRGDVVDLLFKKAKEKSLNLNVDHTNIRYEQKTALYYAATKDYQEIAFSLIYHGAQTKPVLEEISKIPISDFWGNENSERNRAIKLIKNAEIAVREKKKSETSKDREMLPLRSPHSPT